MKEITILSGKGGAGKTSITAALATLSEHAVLCDNDVDAADLHLLLQPAIKEKKNFYGGWKASIALEKCTGCGQCLDYCRFDAIHTKTDGALYINPFQCEGCRLCGRICPAEAITSQRSKQNYWFVSDTRFGIMVHAQMGPGEENSGKLVTHVRKKAMDLAVEKELSYIINDGPPGIGCAAIASLSGTNKVLLVTEPTKSGLHDARRLVELTESFQVPVYAIINKYDINAGMTTSIEHFLEEKGIPLLAKIPFDEEMVAAITAGKTIVEYSPESLITSLINKVWEELKS